MKAKIYFCEKPNIDKINMIDIIALSKLTSIVLNKTISEYTKSLPKNSINLFSISQYLNFINNFKNHVRLKHLPVTCPEIDLDLDLQFFFLHL